MQLDLIEREALVGITVSFTTQELIALKDKTAMIQAELDIATSKDEQPSITPILINPSDVSDIITFISKLTHGAISTKEVNEELFGQKSQRTKPKLAFKI